MCVQIICSEIERKNDHCIWKRENNERRKTKTFDRYESMEHRYQYYLQDKYFQTERTKQCV